jgi:cytoskeletal protein CcmA (bactofilin family)
MNKNLLLTISFLLLAMAAFAQKSGKNPNSSGNEDGGRVNLILPHGNIGINTLDPSERLEVIGNARISDRLFVENIEVTGLSATNITVSEDIKVGRHVLVSGNIGIGVQLPSERLDIDGNLKVSQGIFADAITTNSFQGSTGTFNKSLKVTELFTVDGKTGLGIDAPVERLEVDGNIKVTDKLIATGVQAQSGTFSSSVEVAENLTISGNTGLGVVNPSERLEVGGNLKVSEGIFTESLEGNTYSMNKGTINDLLTVKGTVLVDGNIGIGVPSPAEKLEVNGNVKTTAAFIGKNLQVEEGNFTGNAGIGQNLSVTGSASFVGAAEMTQLTVSGNLQSNNFRTSTASVDGPLAVGGNTFLNGNTGLGVAEPVERLEVDGNVKVSNALFATSLESTDMSLENGTIANQLKVGGDALVAGKVGIGNEEPSEMLDVTGNIRTSGELMGQSLGVKTGNFTSNVAVAQNMSVGGVADFTGAVTMNILKVNSSLQSNTIQSGSGSFTGTLSAGGIVSLDSTLFISGQVGVGTDRIDGYMLSVGGKIRASSDIRVYPSAEWADYVFTDAYHLRSLQEVADYIEQNHHLPELPSAAEVKKEGIDLGAMDALLLQKIEELTLYIIQLEKENKKKEVEKEQLNEQLKQLQTDVNSIKESLEIR